MRKLGVTLALVAASFALVASTAEAAKTSEREGRKFSRKYVKKFSGRDFPDLGWKQRDCWRIGREGAGYYGLFPRGVICGFSSTRETTGYPCWVLGIAVKDGRRYVQTADVPEQPWRGDPAYCDHGPGALDLPPHPLWGTKGGPLRLVPNRATRAGSASSERAPCEKRVDGVLPTIGAVNGAASRRNVSCRKAKRIMKR